MKWVLALVAAVFLVLAWAALFNPGEQIVMIVMGLLALVGGPLIYFKTDQK